MPEEPIPGSRVVAGTKHGTLTVDQIAEMQPGMARLMDELARRFWVVYYAARSGNWDLARYMMREAEKLLGTLGVARPRYAADLAAFASEHVAALARAIEARDWAAFDAAYHAAVAASDVYHAKYRKSFLRFRLPDHPPEWLDLDAR